MEQIKRLNPLLAIMSQNALKLGLIGIISFFVCMLVFESTRSRIESNKLEAIRHSLNEVYPIAVHESEPSLVESSFEFQASELGHVATELFYFPTRSGEVNGIVMPVTAPQGYGGPIKLLLGISSDDQITGLRVIPPHAETPGLGDAIEIKKSDWITTFNGLSLKNTRQQDWALKKEGGKFDAFTGASITPRAIVNAVYQALQYYEDNKQQLQNSYLRSKHNELTELEP